MDLSQIVSNFLILIDVPLIKRLSLSVERENDDKPVLLALECGEAEALKALMDKYYAVLKRYGLKITRDQEVISDSIQDVFLFLWERRSNVCRIESFRPYLFSSVRNNIIRRLRHDGRLKNISVHEFPFADDCLEVLIMEEESAATQKQFLQNHLSQLPHRQREALYLRYYEDLSYDEIGEIMGLKRQAVANYLQLALNKMRQVCKYAVLLFVFILFY